MKKGEAYKRNLANYLEGDDVDPKWVAEFVKQRSKEQPHTLYRCCLIPKAPSFNVKFPDLERIDLEVSIDKLLVSASDKIANAKYAACSFHHDSITPTDGKMLAVIEIINPQVVMSLVDLHNYVTNDYVGRHKGIALTRLEDEREYLIHGPITGKVISRFSVDVLKDKKYKGFLK